MRINSRKIRKILGRVWTTPKRILKSFALMKHQRCIGRNATHITISFNLENQIRIFSYTIFPVKKINVGKILKL
jgi:hypothetical protein